MFSGVPASNDEMAKDIADVFSRLADALGHSNIAIDDEQRKCLLKDCLRHHCRHIQHMRVLQRAVDPYKIVAWAGYILAEKNAKDSSARSIIRTVIQLLDSFLHAEVPRGGLPEDTRNYLEDFVFNEIQSESDHGIGKNGLFVAFHSASKIKSKFKMSMTAGWGSAGWGN